ncbi:MAG: TRAP transporter large permease subunit, partial [Dehalococcoidales bacterium]|nr:TRAP transporter large permease subunit [Dehalococcoidales bacterium]
LFIVLGASIFSYVMSSTNATSQMVSWLTGMNLSKPVLLTMVYVMYIFLGCFLEGTSMQYLTLPVLYPVMIAYGFSGIWFGIVLVILMELGMLTPPMGINLFIVKGIAKGSQMSDIIRGGLPYIFLMLLMVLILTAFPSLVTFLVD